MKQSKGSCYTGQPSAMLMLPCPNQELFQVTFVKGHTRMKATVLHEKLHRSRSFLITGNMPFCMLGTLPFPTEPRPCRTAVDAGKYPSGDIMATWTKNTKPRANLEKNISTHFLFLIQAHTYDTDNKTLISWMNETRAPPHHTEDRKEVCLRPASVLGANLWGTHVTEDSALRGCPEVHRCIHGRERWKMNSARGFNNQCTSSTTGFEI